VAGRIVSATHWQTETGEHLPYVVDGKGVPRVLARLRPRADFGRMKSWRATQPVIPRDQWVECDYSHFNAPILDQGQHGSCVGHGSVTAFTRAWSITGHPIRKFSSCYIYGNINGGRDQGAIVSDAMDLLLSKGTCLESTVPEGMIFRRQFPAGADAEAQKYRAFDCYHLGSFDEIGSALMMGDPVCFGIFVGARFNNLDPEGVPPVGGNGGHCLEGHGLVRLKSGKWGVRTQNSWSVDWGNGGCCVLIEGHYTYGQNYMGGLDAFAIRGTADAPDDDDNPPVVPT
jgi:hypothetical protein